MPGACIGAYAIAYRWLHAGGWVSFLFGQRQAQQQMKPGGAIVVKITGATNGGAHTQRTHPAEHQTFSNILSSARRHQKGIRYDFENSS